MKHYLLMKTTDIEMGLRENWPKELRGNFGVHPVELEIEIIAEAEVVGVWMDEKLYVKAVIEDLTVENVGVYVQTQKHTKELDDEVASFVLKFLRNKSEELYQFAKHELEQIDPKHVLEEVRMLN